MRQSRMGAGVPGPRWERNDLLLRPETEIVRLAGGRGGVEKGRKGLLKNLWKSYENQNIIATFAVRKN